MTWHLLKLVWRRKRASGLIMAEIFLSFLVVFVVATIGLYFLGNYRRSLGFDSRGVWRVQLDSNTDLEQDGNSLAYGRSVDRILREVRQLDAVEAAAALNLVPYDTSTWDWTQDLEDGRAIEFHVNHAGVGVPEVLGMRLEKGRWFEEADAALGWDPVVVNASLATEIFRDEDPIGKRIPIKDRKENELRVVGVIDDFRKGGELAPHVNYLFQRAKLEGSAHTQPRNLVLRVAEGTPAIFEETLMRRLQALEPTWTFETTKLEAMRALSLRLQLVPLFVGATVAGFLLFMVALGLSGVLWQNVTQRRQEIGLRRAVGAAATKIHRQILTELMLMTSLSLALGLLLVLQLPAFDLVAFLGRGVLFGGAAVAATLIYLLSSLCGWYPSRLSTRIHPVEALHYD
jgi:putative ABC transport system permease protein